MGLDQSADWFIMVLGVGDEFAEEESPTLNVIGTLWLS